MKITIIGAGIGGLTAAIALLQKGFQVEIFETTAAFKKAGSGINLAINAMQVYKRLGVYDDIVRKAHYTHTVNIATKGMKLIMSAKFKKFEKMFDAKNVAIHRAVLHEILLKHIGDTPLHLNKKLTSLTQKNGQINLRFEDGATHISNILIGADGIHSTVRKSLFEHTELRDAAQICWRGVAAVKIDKKYKQELNEIWAKGKRFGFVQIAENEIYWYALTNKGKGTNRAVDLLHLFADCHPVVQQIIRETAEKNILCNEIWDLKPIDKWHKENVCLLGDAGHATTPNMGQGAAQAIESALALSICLKEEESIEKAFVRYQQIRKKKARYIINTSWTTGKLAQTDNPLVCVLRNLAMGLVPQYITERQNKKIFELNY